VAREIRKTWKTPLALIDIAAITANGSMKRSWVDFGVTWAKNALGTEKSIPTPSLTGIAVDIASALHLLELIGIVLKITISLQYQPYR